MNETRQIWIGRRKFRVIISPTTGSRFKALCRKIPGYISAGPTPEHAYNSFLESLDPFIEQIKKVMTPEERQEIGEEDDCEAEAPTLTLTAGQNKAKKAIKQWKRPNEKKGKIKGVAPSGCM